MTRIVLTTVMLLTLAAGTLPSKAQNPFISRDGPTPSANRSGWHLFLDRIGDWQQQLNQRMAELTREAREKRSLRPLLTLLVIAFSYGVLHAAGPGHGKAVATFYLLSHGKKLGRGIFLGTSIAVLHGLSGVSLVLAVHFVLKMGVSGSLEAATRTTQLISYSLIVLLGAIMLGKGLLSWYGRHGNDEANQREEKGQSPLAMAVAVGVIPCPGVVLAMLFCLSMNMLGLGLLLAFFLILGMATTISAVGVAGLAGKNLALGALGRRDRALPLFQHSIETAAALMVMMLGLLFLATTL
jgi:ABC-type nickel/cobalt efflux system permease component RcnA